MSTAPRNAVTPTRPKVSQDAEGLTAPSIKIKGWVHKNPASFSSPRLPDLPSAPSNNPTHHPFPHNSMYSSSSSDSGIYGAPGTNSHANHQGYSASPNFATQPVQNQTQVVNGAYFLVPGYLYYGCPVGPAAPSHTTCLPPPGYTQADHHAYSPQGVLPSQSEHLHRALDQLHSAHQTASNDALQSKPSAKRKHHSKVRADNLDGDQANGRETHPNEERAFHGDFVCLFCLIFTPKGNKMSPYRYSCEGTLRRHVKDTHTVFLGLLEPKYKDLRILERRTAEERETEDFTKLIMLCILEQMEARQRGVVISDANDLTLQYPRIVELMGSCL